MQRISVYPGVNDQILEDLRRKVVNMSSQCKVCAIVLDEMSIQEFLVYNVEHDDIEGFEDFGATGKTKYVANHAVSSW